MGQIIDVFNFFNELELLEIRLNELDDFVDKFVIVESTKTFQNKPKDLVYEKNKAQFSRWHDRITHVVIEDSPDTEDSWAVEYFQFNAADRGLPDLRADDTIMWCCTDEIPKKSTIREWIKHNRGPAMMMQWPCGGYLNCWNNEHSMWTGGRLMSGDQWKASADKYESFRKHWLGIHIQDAGWHFCNMGGAERYRLKIESFAHKELNHESFKSGLEYNLQCCYNLHDPKTGRGMKLLPWDQMPPYVAQNREKFAHLLIPDR